MKRLAIVRGGVAMVLMLGILVAVASSAEASPSGQLGVFTRQGLSLARAQAALATQSQVETAELPTKLEEALGASFAGVWFEPSKAKFCIGVVSGASRRAAEQVVAQAGLAGVVSYVSVRSTWSELISAQHEWGGKLVHLAGQQFSTGLTASNNAVSVTLSSSVPKHERALLEREAARSHVNVSITVVPPEALELQPKNSQCEIIPRGNYAFCSKPIAAGVLITPNEQRKGYCTAGPLAILANPLTLAAELETLLLTAGHCLEGNPRWFTANHPQNLLSEIGPRLQFENGLAGDYGDIEVRNPAWLEAGTTPALAQVTHYEDNGLRETRNVIGEAASVEKSSFCKQGATSAEQCGEITATNQLALVENPSTRVILHIDGLVRTNACTEPGDSGGPYHTLPLGNAVRILGTEIGGSAQKCEGLFCPTSCVTVYEPIKTSLTALGLALLTILNQTRHTVGKHPLFLTESGQELLVVGHGGAVSLRGSGGTILCELVLIHGFVLNKSPLIHRLKFLFEGKCELHSTSIGLVPCIEPIHAHLGLGELGLVLGNKTVGIYIAPSEGASELVEMTCGVNSIKVTGAVIGEIPEKVGLINQYNKPLGEITMVLEAENKNSTKQAVTSIELLGLNMSGVHLESTGFFAGEVSEELSGAVQSDGGIEICTREPQFCP